MSIIYREPQYISYKEFLKLEKIHCNRPLGNETEEERLKYGYSKQEVEKEERWFKSLKKTIELDIKNNKFINSKVFIIGQVIGDEKNYLVDGQHTGAIYVELIKEGVLKEDTKFFYEVRKYNAFDEMVSELHNLNNGNKWSMTDHARSDGLDSEGRKIYLRMAEKYHEKLPDGVIKQCIFGQHNGKGLFNKNYTSHYDELLTLTENLKKACEETHYLSHSQINRIIGTTHGASTFRDLMRVILRENALRFPRNTNEEKIAAKEEGIRLCNLLIEGVLGRYSKIGWTPNQAATMLNINSQTEFKKEFNIQLKRKAIRFAKRKNESSEFLEKCIETWSNK